LKVKKSEKHLLSRRETLRLMGAAGATALVGWGEGHKHGLWLPGHSGSIVEAGSLPDVLRNALFSPSPLPMVRATQTLACVTRPAQTEGPYFVDELLNRADIRSDPTTNTVKEGAPLRLKFNVNRVNGDACSPLPGAQVDIWHCDALGIYAGVGAGMGNPNTLGQKFLRGYQVTDSNGSVEFTTIYPGYYVGRTVHIHYKIRLFAGSQKTYEFTSQLYFDDSLTDQVFTLAPYNTKSARGTRNSNDGIYSSQALLGLTSDGQGGYVGAFDIGLSGVPDSVATVSTVSAASFGTDGVTSEGIAALFGSGLALSALAATTQPLPTELGGVQVRVRDAGGTERAAPLFFVSPVQINFQIPPNTSAGNATISVVRDGGAVGQGAVTIETVAPGLFAANSNGKEVAAAVVLRQRSDGAQTFEPVAQFNQASNRFEAIPIDLGAETDQLFLIGFGTGFRHRSALSAVSCTIGGTNAEVTFAGAQGELAGLDQTNIALPRSLAGRGAVNVVFSADGKTANTVTINIT
jgi:uncharacterized protein (TIGR03437 family)